MCSAPKAPPPPPPPAPAPAPPAPAASVVQGSPEMSRGQEEEALLRSRRRGRSALRIDLNVPGGSGSGPNIAR